ncbi:MAG: HAD family hydrolase [Patescibacteria group bacterium]
MKEYDAYLFDWDGTLTMTHDIALEIVGIQLERYGLRLSDRQIVGKIFGRYAEGMKEVGIPEKDLTALKKEIYAVLKNKMPLASLYPGAGEVLSHLRMRGGCKLALITATWREIVDIAVAKHELIDTFDVIITGDEVKAQKPDPDGILAALKTLGVPPTRAVMLGDSEKDILAGRNAGTDTILFYPPEHVTQHDLTELEECDPTYIIHSWHEMLDQLQ